MAGVVKLFPVNKIDPPKLELYQLITEPKFGVADRATVPKPQRVPEADERIVGVIQSVLNDSSSDHTLLAVTLQFPRTQIKYAVLAVNPGTVTEVTPAPTEPVGIVAPVGGVLEVETKY